MIQSLSSKLSDLGTAWVWGTGGTVIVLVGLAVVAFHRAARVRRTGGRRYLGLAIAGALAVLCAVAVLVVLYLKTTAVVYAEV